MIHVPAPSSSPPPDPDHQRDTEIVAYMVALVHARSKGDYLKAADAHRELERRGVLVRFLRKRKGVENV